MSGKKKEGTEKKIDNIKTYIRRVLAEQKMYSPEMSYQIELLASDILVFRKIRDLILTEMENPNVIEKSREGEERKKENPMYNLMLKFGNSVRKDLRSLKMNREIPKCDDDTNTDKEDDALKILMRKVTEEEE